MTSLCTVHKEQFLLWSSSSDSAGENPPGWRGLCCFSVLFCRVFSSYNYTNNEILSLLLILVWILTVLNSTFTYTRRLQTDWQHVLKTKGNAGHKSHDRWHGFGIWYCLMCKLIGEPHTHLVHIIGTLHYGLRHCPFSTLSYHVHREQVFNCFINNQLEVSF